MNSQTGLDYIIENKEFTQKLASALDTTNTQVKKQVIELLSALCVYSSEGYERALSALEHYKEQKRQTNRFKLVTTELQSSDDPAYKTALLAFCNCIIISTEKVEDRVKIRNELVGQKLLEVIKDLRKEVENVSDEDLSVQLDVFDEQKASDEDQLPQSTTEGLDLSSHTDIFTAIIKQITSTEAESSFLSILQHLLQVADPKEPNAALKWQTIEKLVYSATLLDNREEAEKLFHSGQKRLAKAIHGDDIDSKTPRLNQSFDYPEEQKDAENKENTVPTVSNTPAAAPPEVAAPPPQPPPPPPPPLLPGPIPPPPGIPPPPPPGVPGPPPPPGMGLPMMAPKKLPQQVIPVPKAKTRKIQWQKIPTNKVIGKKNVWSNMSQSSANESMVDFGNIERLFLVEDPTIKQSVGSDGNSTTKKKKDSNEVNLLDQRTSLKVNIFLKQFKLGHSEIVQMLRSGQSKEIGAENLRGLLKILPKSEEIETLNNYSGDRERLANAEKFYLQLLALPHYELRVQIMLLREEFANTIGWIGECVDTIIVTAQDMMESKDLQQILYLVLVTGNFLNSGAYVGDAAGIKITSLLKLSELRSNKPKVNLLHVVVMQIEKYKPSLLNFWEGMKYLKNTAEANIDTLASDITQLANKVSQLSKQLEKSSTDLQKQFSPFLSCARREVALVQADIKEIDHMKLELAEYFAEDPKTFKLEDCFAIMRTFCDKFKKAIQENKQRELLEKKQLQRQKLKAESSKVNQSGTFVKRAPTNSIKTADRSSTASSDADDESHIVDNILGDIRNGFIQKKSFGDTAFTVTKVKKVSLQGVESMSSPTKCTNSESQNNSKPVIKGFDFLDKTDGEAKQSEENNNIPETATDIPKRVRQSPATQTSRTNSEALFDFLVQSEETESDKNFNFERKKSLRRRRGRDDVTVENKDAVKDTFTGSSTIRDPSPAARSSDNEADISGESANNSLERPNSRPASLTNLHGLQEVLPGQSDNINDNVKILVPTKFKSQEEEDSSFTRNNKLRASFKDQLSKRYNKKHDVESVIQKIQASTTTKKEEAEKKKPAKENTTPRGKKMKETKTSTKQTEELARNSKVLQRVNSISSEASNESEVTAGLLHSLRARREVEEQAVSIPKQKDVSNVGSRISNKLKALYSTDDEDNGLFYQPTRKTKTADSKDDQQCVDSGVEMNGDTGSNRNSYSSVVDVIDVTGKELETADTSTLKDTSSSETIVEKTKKKVTNSKKPTTVNKKKTSATADKTTKSSSTKTKMSASTKSKTSSNKVTSADTKSKTSSDKVTSAASGKSSSSVFDRLSSSRGSTISRVTSKDSVMSHDSEDKPKRVSGANKLAMNRAASQAASEKRKVTKKLESGDENRSTPSSTLRRSTSSLNSTSNINRTKARASMSKVKTTDSNSTSANATSLSDRASFLQKMLNSKNAAAQNV